MKIKVIIRTSDNEKEIEIPCGHGDKTFKWLAMVAYQRYSLLAPNGILRRREDIRGLSETAQHIPDDLYLENGVVPHPSCLLSSFVGDGDKVYISLQNSLSIDRISGTPQKSDWKDFAFKKSSVEEVREDDNEDNDNDGSVDLRDEHSRANVMRILLESQMINNKLLRNTVNVLFTGLSQVFLKIDSIEMNDIRECFCLNWDLIREIFESYSPADTMTIDEFAQFVTDANIFSDAVLETINDIYRRSLLSLERLNSENSNSVRECIDFQGFAISLIYIAQFRYHDIFEKQIRSKSGADAVKLLFGNYVKPLGELRSYNAILKEAFCNSSILSALREHVDNLYLVYQRYLSKARDIPVVLKLEIMSEVLFDAKLQDDDDHGATTRLFRGVRKGTLFPREVTKDLFFTFPEFVEACCRAGYNKLSKNHDSGRMDYKSLFLQGAQAVVDVLNKPPSNIKRYY